MTVGAGAGVPGTGTGAPPVRAGEPPAGGYPGGVKLKDGGTPVTIHGFSGSCGAHNPAKLEIAFVISPSSAPQADTHS